MCAGDGITAGGGYTLSFDGQAVAAGGAFRFGEVKRMYLGGSPVPSTGAPLVYNARIDIPAGTYQASSTIQFVTWRRW